MFKKNGLEPPDEFERDGRICLVSDEIESGDERVWGLQNRKYLSEQLTTLRVEVVSTQREKPFDDGRISSR